MPREPGASAAPTKPPAPDPHLLRHRDARSKWPGRSRSAAPTESRPIGGYAHSKLGREPRRLPSLSRWRMLRLLRAPVSGTTAPGPDVLARPPGSIAETLLI